MHNNTTLSNMTQLYKRCNIDIETLVTVFIYASIIASICAFIGNLLVILIVYRNKNLRTTTNYFIVSMSVSDVLFPLFTILKYKFLVDSRSRLSKLVGNLLCKLLPFLSNVSYEVSMLTLVVIAGYRFSAVMYPLRARVQNKRKRFLVLLFTWVIPIAMTSPLLFLEFNEKKKICRFPMFVQHFEIWSIAHMTLFFFFPLLIMLVLYPVIIFKLKQHKAPGNVINIQAITKRRRQNCRLTVMFIVITVAFLLCWGITLILWVLDVIVRYKLDSCTPLYIARRITAVVFHAINPVIYFIFLSSFRQGFKNIFCSSCCIKTRPQAPADNIELKNIPQGQMHS